MGKRNRVAKQSKKKGRQKERLHTAVPSQPAPVSLAHLPEHETTRPLRQNALLHLQAQRGNAYVQRNFHLDTMQFAEEDEMPLPVKGLGKEETLAGHGNLDHQLMVQRDNGSGIAPATASPSPPATITLTVNAPTIIRLPKADISANRAKTGVAGWCTPHYSVMPTARTATTLGLAVTLDFTVELASEYDGDRLTVLSDHENGHIRISERLARQHFVDDLQANLRVLPNFLDTLSIQRLIEEAAIAFTVAEERESNTYDKADYPRMHDAYWGAMRPLDELASESPPIQRMVDALQAFNDFVTNMNSLGTHESGLEALTHTIIEARTALSYSDVSRLQYNPEFKTLVATSHNFVTGMRTHISETGRTNLHELELTLGTFTWAPTI